MGYRSAIGADLNPRKVPTIPVQINRAHPLAQNLVTCFVPGSPLGLTDYCSGSVFVTTEPVVPSEVGPALITTRNTQVLTPQIGTLNGGFSAAMFINCTVGNGGALLSSRAPSDNSWDFQIQSGGVIHTDIGDGSNWLSTNTNSSVNFPLNTWGGLGATYGPTEGIIYTAGIRNSPVGWGTGSPLCFDATHTLNYNGFWGGATLASLCLWQGVLTPDSMAWFHAEPFAMFSPIIRRTYSISAAPPIVNMGWLPAPSQPLIRRTEMVPY